MIPGIIGRKIGMTQVFSDNGTAEAVTAIEAGPCVVTQVKAATKEGYTAVQLGFGEVKRLKSSQREHLKGPGQFKHLREFRVDDIEAIEVGQRVDASLFKEGDLIDMGVAHDIVEKSGAWFSFQGQRIGQGREAVKAFLKEHAETAQEIEKLIREKLMPVSPPDPENGNQGKGASPDPEVVPAAHSGRRN